MNFVIPMAGAGSRFVEAGYDVPKMFLMAKGKTLLEWSVDSLPLNLCTNLVFIYQSSLNNHIDVEKFILSKYSKIKNIQFLAIPNITRGQAETVYLAKELIVLDKPMVIFNIDTKFSSSTLEACLLNKDNDGVLGAFYNNSNKFSFAKVDPETNFVVEVKEKVAISNLALTGLYSFKIADSFFQTAQYEIENDIKNGGEFYIAPMYNNLIKRGQKFVIDNVESYDVLGTPQEYLQFLSK